MLHKRKPMILLSWLLAALLLAGCGAEPTPSPDTPAEQTVDFFAMDTFMSFRLYGAGRCV